MAKNSMWTIDMQRCMVCSQAEGCPDRQRLIDSLNRVTNEMHIDKQTEGGAKGIIIVACQRG